MLEADFRPEIWPRQTSLRLNIINDRRRRPSRLLMKSCEMRLACYANEFGDWVNEENGVSKK
jgi:hypothetical protein